MLLIMGVNLYTVRIILDKLGVEDYGLYNVIGGIVTLLSFLSGTLASSSQRFLAFEIGRKNIERLKQVFSLNLLIYFLIAVLLLLIFETAGVWFINNRLNIPPNREVAAFWTFQFSIFTFIVTLLYIPFNASIIAHEKMGIYAYVGILEAIIKLLIAFILSIFAYDKLILYSFLIFVTSLIVGLIYFIYCRSKFVECRISFLWNKALFKEIFGYSMWNLIGSVSNVLKNQGSNILLNIFFNPIVNAAWAIAYQINSTLNNFSNNFYTAVRPQITKSFAADDHEYMKKLVYQSSKFGFYLILILAIPLIFEMEFILKIWLNKLPDKVVLFSRLIVINSLIDVINLPLVASVQATGKIKLYQTVVSVLLLFNLPVSYLLLNRGFQPEVCIYVSICLSIICFIPRLLIGEKVASIPAMEFFYQVFITIISVTILSLLLPAFIYLRLDEGYTRFFAVSITWLISSLLVIYIIGLNKNERNLLKDFARDRIILKLKKL